VRKYEIADSEQKKTFHCADGKSAFRAKVHYRQIVELKNHQIFHELNILNLTSQIAFKFLFRSQIGAASREIEAVLGSNTVALRAHPWQLGEIYGVTLPTVTMALYFEY
jgi:hypothetical protein